MLTQFKIYAIIQAIKKNVMDLTGPTKFIFLFFNSVNKSNQVVSIFLASWVDLDNLAYLSEAEI